MRRRRHPRRQARRRRPRRARRSSRCSIAARNRPAWRSATAVSVMVYKDLGLVDAGPRRAPPAVAARRPGDRPLPLLDDRLDDLGEHASRRSAWAPQRTVAVGHNGNLVNTRQLLELLPGGQRRLVGTTDTELLTALLARRARRRPGRGAAARCCRGSPAPTRWCVMDEQRVIGVRDPHGFRPLVLGRCRRPTAGCSPLRRPRSTSSGRSSCATSSPARWSVIEADGRALRSASPRPTDSCACSS